MEAQSEEEKLPGGRDPPAKSPKEQVRVKSEGVIKLLPTQKQGHIIPTSSFLPGLELKEKERQRHR